MNFFWGRMMWVDVWINIKKSVIAMLFSFMNAQMNNTWT